MTSGHGVGSRPARQACAAGFARASRQETISGRATACSAGVRRSLGQFVRATPWRGIGSGRGVGPVITASARGPMRVASAVGVGARGRRYRCRRRAGSPGRHRPAGRGAPGRAGGPWGGSGRRSRRFGAGPGDMAEGQGAVGMLGEMGAAERDRSGIVVALDPDPGAPGHQPGEPGDRLRRRARRAASSSSKVSPRQTTRAGIGGLDIGFEPGERVADLVGRQQGAGVARETLRTGRGAGRRRRGAIRPATTARRRAAGSARHRRR